MKPDERIVVVHWERPYKWKSVKAASRMVVTYPIHEFTFC